MSRTKDTTEQDKHAAGGPGKASKEGHIDPEKHNKPGQKQSAHPRGPGGEGGTKGVPDEDVRDSG
jgi:hypothetical protein